MDAALKELYGTCPAKEISVIINAKFGTGFSPTAIYNRAVMKQLRSYSSYHYYTEEQDEWLRQNASKYDSKDLAHEFNKAFQADVDSVSVRNQCQVKGIKLGRSSHKGYRNYRNAPIGAEYISSRGTVYVKVSDVRRDGKHQVLNWKRKSHLVWEQHHGEIPEGHVIVHLDGNPTNCDISNLECTTNSINGQLAIPCKGTSPELKRCAIKMKTLEKILEGVERNETN
jgi:hypothetical protein